MDNFTHRVQTILDAHPLLHDGGYGTPKGYKADLAEWRAHLTAPDSLAEIETLADWIDRNLLRAKSINYRHTSYGLKHIAERQIGYVSNGQFIVAALLLGYKTDLAAYNLSFNFTEASIRQADRTIKRNWEISPFGRMAVATAA